MKQSMIAFLMLLSASFILPSCEKAVSDEYPQMEAYYVESKGLNSVSIDSIKTFSSKVDGFVTTYPLAKEHEKYPLILDNIKEASLRITLSVDTVWGGDTIIHF